MSLSMHVDTLPSTCGVGVLYGFWDSGTRWSVPIGDNPEEAGCGWYVAGFINTPNCLEAYNELCEKLTLVYQSPVRLNVNSNRDFFFCIFDAGQPDEPHDDDDEEDEEDF